MRLSAVPSSPFYSAPLVKRATVYLNGVYVSPVVEFDTDAGWVVIVRIRDDGRARPHAQSPVGTQCKRYRGRVQCVLRQAQETAEPSPVHPDWIVEDPPLSGVPDAE